MLNDPNDTVELRKVEKCLKFIMDPIIDSLESTNNIDCIKNLLKKIKMSKNSLEPNNENVNVVSKIFLKNKNDAMEHVYSIYF
jgi:hypothetical protein